MEEAGSFTANEAISDADDRFDATAARAHFLTQAPDVNVQSARVAKIAVAPYVVKKLLAGSDAAAVFDEVFEKSEFLAGKLNVVAI
jgi:hypothetical protein